MRASSVPVLTRASLVDERLQHGPADLRAHRRFLRRLEVAGDRRAARELGLRHDDDVLGPDGRGRRSGFRLRVSGFTALAPCERHGDGDRQSDRARLACRDD